MSLAPSYNLIYSRDRRQRCIMLTADLSPITESVLLELYARLMASNCQIQTSLCTYMVTIEGATDHLRLHGLLQQQFWLSAIFDDRIANKEDRHLLN